MPRKDRDPRRKKLRSLRRLSRGRLSRILYRNRPELNWCAPDAYRDRALQQHTRFLEYQLLCQMHGPADGDQNIGIFSGVTLRCRHRMNLRECMQLAKDAGFDGIELNYDLENDLSPKSGTKEYTKIRKMAEKIGIVSRRVARADIDQSIGGRDGELDLQRIDHPPGDVIL